jgi:hypothetical protein
MTKRKYALKFFGEKNPHKEISWFINKDEIHQSEFLKI